MQRLQLLLIIFLSVYLAACSNKNPEFIPKSNTYKFDFYNSKNGNLQNESLVYTFNVESMEQLYYEKFCAGLKDCSNNINNVKTSPLFGGFDLSQKPIINNKLGITLVDTYRLSYTTTGQKHELRTVSGAVFIPDIPKNKIKGIILYFHPTFFARTSVPSFGMTDNSHDNTLASVFATNGYIVVAPDYIGMGIDKSVPHPFILYPLVNANDGLSMLIAARHFLERRGLTDKLPLFITGFSEGGGYALWFSRLYQEQIQFRRLVDKTNFKLTLITPISGAYNLSNVTYNYLFDNISIWSKDTYKAYSSMIAEKLKPSLAAFAFISYAFYNLNSDYSKVFNHDFFTLQCKWQSQSNCNYENKHINLLQLFDQKEDLQIVNNALNASRFKYFNGNFFTSQTNNITPLLNPEFITSQDFINSISNADIYYWYSSFPTNLIYLTPDSVVSPYNTEYAYRGMIENHSTNLKKTVMDNRLIKVNTISYLPDFDVDHPLSLPYVTLIALKDFNEALATSGKH